MTAADSLTESRRRMIVLRVPSLTHFRVRALEWLLAAITATMGVILLNPYPTLDSPIFRVLVEVMPESVWQWVFVTIGVTRLLALYRNGAWVPSPWVRMTTALLSVVIWVWVSIGCAMTGTAYLLLAIFPWFIIGDLYAVGRAAKDARLTREARAALPEAPVLMPPVQ